jgi:FolB domain-containing protein
MDQIFIRDLRAVGVIGIYDFERTTPQEIIINLTLFADLSQAGHSDNLEDSIDYQKVAEQAKQHAETARRLTVEALAEDLAAMCLAIPSVQRVRVRVEKPTILPICQSVGVEIERRRLL